MTWNQRERHRKRSCVQKVRYGSEPLAREGAKEMLRRSGLRKGGVYPCEFCGLWHVSSEGRGPFVVTLD